MYVYEPNEVDPSLDYQLVDAHNGLLELYTLGEKTATLGLGELIIRQLKSAIASLTNLEPRVLFKSTVTRFAESARGVLLLSTASASAKALELIRFSAVVFLKVRITSRVWEVACVFIAQIDKER